MNVFFITGIDTGCGKTYSTGLMARYLKETGINVITQKLIQTGCSGISEDIAEHRRLMRCGLFEEDINQITCPYVFPYASSPHLAAKLHGTKIDTNVLSNATQQLTQKFDIVLLEGVGGLHVPIDDDFLIIDYIKMQNYPVILVSSSKLGSINHTLMSIESCSFHHINLFAVVYNRLPESDNVIADNTLHEIKKKLSNTYPNSILVKTGTEENTEKDFSPLFQEIFKYKL